MDFLLLLALIILLMGPVWIDPTLAHIAKSSSKFRMYLACPCVAVMVQPSIKNLIGGCYVGSFGILLSYW